MGESVVLLHGFAGTCRAWDGVVARLPRERYKPLALDLPGHGAAATGEHQITYARCVDSVLARSPGRFTLCGYSLGGRVALGVALAAPERVTRLVLVATSAGIDEPEERAVRRAADGLLAEELEREPYESFIERWRSQPLFEGEPAEVGALAREDHRRNRPEALAAVLRGVGAGEMEPLWHRLSELKMPVAMLVGDRDEKFQLLGRRMAELIDRATVTVVSGGHALPLENPAAVALALQGIDAGGEGVLENDTPTQA